MPELDPMKRWLTWTVYATPLMTLTTDLGVIEYSDDDVFLFHPQHHLPAPLPDNYILIVIVVSVWIVLIM